MHCAVIRDGRDYEEVGVEASAQIGVIYDGKEFSRRRRHVGGTPHCQITEFDDLLFLKLRDCLDPTRFRSGKDDLIAGMYGV